MPDEYDDFEIELDWEEEPANELVHPSKYKIGDKLVAVGSYLPGGDRAVAVVTIEKIVDWSTINPTQTGAAYVVKRVWGDRLAMSVMKKKRIKGQSLSVPVEDMYYVSGSDLHPLGKERTTKSIRARIFQKKRRKKS